MLENGSSAANAFEVEDDDGWLEPEPRLANRF